MAKLLYSATMSLDGFIAGPGGDISWLTPYLGPNPAIDDVIGQIGALLVGHRTFRGDDPHKGSLAARTPLGPTQPKRSFACQRAAHQGCGRVHPLRRP